MTTNLRVGIVLSLVIIVVLLFFSYRKPSLEIVQPISSVTFRCAEGKSITAAFFEGKQVAVAPGAQPIPSGSVGIALSDGRTIKLAQTISADGGRYANSDESVIFWNKGRGVSFTEHGEQSYQGCMEVANDSGGLAETYLNGSAGFSLRFPEGYAVKDTYRYLDFGPGKDIEGVKFTIPSAMATGTNLSADSFISVEHIPNTENCSATSFLQRATAYDLTDVGVTYSVASSTGAGAGNRYEETVFVLPGTRPCLAVRYFVHYGVIENYPEGLVREFNKASLLESFNAIRRSLIVTQ